MVEAQVGARVQESVLTKGLKVSVILQSRGLAVVAGALKIDVAPAGAAEGSEVPTGDGYQKVVR